MPSIKNEAVEIAAAEIAGDTKPPPAEISVGRKPSSMFDLPRSWYLVPYYAKFNESGTLDEEGIGMLGSDEITVVKAIITERPLQIQAYDRKGGQCLVGTFGPMTAVPNGWQGISAEEARKVFKQIKKREPTDAEVS